MDLPKKQGNRREIGGFFEIHRIRWKTPKFGGVKNPGAKFQTTKSQQKMENNIFLGLCQKKSIMN